MTLLDFAAAVGDLPEVSEEARREFLVHLTGLALLARRAGVVPTLQQLAASGLELEAWVEAGRRYDVEQAQRAGLAAQGARGRALVNAEVDGGDAADELLVHEAADALERRDRAPG